MRTCPQTPCSSFVLAIASRADSPGRQCRAPRIALREALAALHEPGSVVYDESGSVSGGVVPNRSTVSHFHSGKHRTPRLAALPVPQRRSTSRTVMLGTAAPTPDLPPRIMRDQSCAHQGVTVGHLTYRTSLITGCQDVWLGLAPPPSLLLSLCCRDDVLKLTRWTSSVLFL